MRYSTTLLPLAATAAAFVIPDEATSQQLVLEPEQQAEKPVSSSWWDRTHNLNDFLSSAESTFETALDALEKQASKLSSSLPKVEFEVGSEITNFLAPSDYAVPGHGHWHVTNLTVYQSIKASNYSKKFAALVDEHPDIVKKLNSTSANITAFIPTDHAFEKIPHDDKDHKPPKEFLEKLIKYHVVPDFYPAGRVLAHHTLPTALEEESLGGRPQRLRVSVGLFGVKLNFFSKIVYANLHTSNGVLHGVDNILVPPPPAKTLISLFPTKFSTLELAAEKTGLKRHGDSHHELTGLTVFAPTNTAFQRLGPGANAFLFNTEKGLHYLRALLAYHIVANETLYSDAYYGPKAAGFAPSLDLAYNADADTAEEEDGAETKGAKHYHLDLPTLLDDAHLAVDISRWFGFITIKVNGHVDVAIQDGLARNGVLQVVDHILIPPHNHKGAWNGEVEGEISVEELVERLEPFIKKDIGKGETGEEGIGEL
ncbi:putative fasciclin domain family protein [Daldinia childiae]|uniref:putative fasciclin domain family protein n=1 Tax=Daldinia childiae TaxID=326645 RepID=UPI0014481363|nr:putative fasciclin domain family protein [Daldinia childiae]KAF3054903.1 putative fasciclin domain family protein [Daldinia childiae]